MFGKCSELVWPARGGEVGGAATPVPNIFRTFSEHCQNLFEHFRTHLGGSPPANVRKCSENVRKMFGTGVAGPGWGGWWSGHTSSEHFQIILRTRSEHFQNIASHTWAVARPHMFGNVLKCSENVRN